MRRVLVIGAVLAAAVVAVVLVGRSSGGDGGYRVRAIFDSAFSLIQQEDVKVAGVTVGKIESLDVTPDDKAAVVMKITEPGFQDFRSDARCTIRPQSLIGEKYVECTLTEPRAPGQREAPPLRRIRSGPGEGERLLPVTNTSRPVDLDLLNNITRLPERQRLAIVLDELGAGLGGRGADLNATIRRANPALGETNKVLAILASQNQVLRELAVSSDRVLAPLARDRARVADFIVKANDVSRATAERRADLERVFARLPRFLAELRPTMARLGSFSDQSRPVLGDLRAVAPDVNRVFRELGPFSQAGIPALRTLGEATAVGGPALVRSKPIIDDLRRLTATARPVALNLRDLTESFRDTGGIERLMDYAFYITASINGYDQYGHYLRAGLIVNNCSSYSTTAQPGCSSNFDARKARDAATAEGGTARSARAVRARAARSRSRSKRIPADLAPYPKGAGSSSSSRSSSASRSTTAPGALRMPRALLPGSTSASAGAPAATAGGPTPAPSGAAQNQAQDGLLDYLLGGGA